MRAKFEMEIHDKSIANTEEAPKRRELTEKEKIAMDRHLKESQQRKIAEFKSRKG